VVVNPETLNKSVIDYINEVRKDMPIDKAYLFGSYAKGNPDEWSDIDICFFSDYFIGKHNIGIRLLKIAERFFPDMVFEPHAVPSSELENDNPFVKEILRTGREISIDD
jgi:predicted nucleotidyltransferase